MAGRFITLEGGEGSGKSTQVKRLAAALEEIGIATFATREPGGSPGAEEIRGLLVNGAPGRWDALTETLLVYAARADHVKRTIGPALFADKWVICDRFTDSTYAYQGAGRGLARETIRRIDSVVLDDFRPDFTLMLDVDVETGLKRASARGAAESRFESFDRDFHERLRQAFTDIAKRNPDRCALIDASQSQDDVAAAIWSAVEKKVRALMAKRAKISEPNESDRIEGFAHPRETSVLIGQDLALARAARAIRGGKPPQGWLISGPPGIGKATFAYRIARYLLTYGARDTGPEDLSVPPNDPNALQLAAGSHPGLIVLKRGVNDKTGKLMNELPVDEVRRLTGFFGMTSGAGGWRIAIVDTADDMNDSAANAILKLLEEPPSRAMLILLANRPGQLLPTIRSRCQRLELRPLEAARIADGLNAHLPDTDAEDRAQLARLSGGTIGAALQLASGEGRELAAEADRLIENAATPDVIALLALGDRLWRMKDGLSRLGDFLLEALAARIRARAHQPGANLARWTALLSRLEDSFARTRGLNLEPRQTLLMAARDLAATAKRAGPL